MYDILYLQPLPPGEESRKGFREEINVKKAILLFN